MTLSSSACPPNPMWSRHGDKYYGASLYTMTYSAASTYCAYHGGQMAQVDTQADFLHVMTAAGCSIVDDVPLAVSKRSCLSQVGYQTTLWLGLENPKLEACASSGDCDKRLTNSAGDAVETATFMAHHKQLSFNLGLAGVGADCVALNGAASFEAASCSDLNYAFCEATCTKGDISSLS